MWNRIRAGFLFLFLFFALTLSLQSEQLLEKENETTESEEVLFPRNTPTVVNKIHIDALDAFDPKIPQYRSWPFRVMNKLHNRTNNSFIERELLIRKGDQVDDDLIEESERNLRKHSFLTDVRIEQKQVAPGKVDLYVHTEDQWTTQVEVSAGKSSGFSTFQFSIEESNFLGLGKTIGLAYDRDPERTTYNFLYYDPQFLNSRWDFKSDFQDASDGWRYVSSLVKPFYSLDTKWAYGFNWDSGTSTKKLHYKGKSVAEIDTDHRTGIFFAARSWGERYNKKRFGFTFNVDSLLYPNPARVILPEATTVKQIARNLRPIDRESYQYGAIFKWDRQNFIKESYLDNFGRVEDLPVGLQLAAVVTRSQTTDSEPNYYSFDTIAQYTNQLNQSQYLALYSEFSARRMADGSLSNVYFNSYAHYYLQMPELNLRFVQFPRQTFAANFSTTLTHEIDAPFQISLGENEGLRGYNFKSFTGQNRILLNLEDRIFTPFNFRLLGIGLVGFMDAGYVWSSEEHLRFSDFGVSAGIGLRLGLKKSQSSRVVRVDLAFPLRGEKSGFTSDEQKGYSISVSSGHIFNVLEELPQLFRLF